MATLSMRDDAPAPHKPRPFLITLLYNDKQQALMRPETLSNVRSNAVWTFNLPIDIKMDTIILRYKDEARQERTVQYEAEWAELRSHRRLKTFTVEVVDKASSPTLNSGEDSGFGNLASSPNKANTGDADASTTEEDIWATGDTAGDAWGDSIPSAGGDTAADPWGENAGQEVVKDEGVPANAGPSGLWDEPIPAPSASQSKDKNLSSVTHGPTAGVASSKPEMKTEEEENKLVLPSTSSKLDNESLDNAVNQGGPALAAPVNTWNIEQDQEVKPIDTFTAPTNAMSTSASVDIWGEEVTDAPPAPPSAIISAWDDIPAAGIGSNLPAASAPPTDEAWGGSTTSTSTTSYSRFSGDRGRGRGRGRGSGRGHSPGVRGGFHDGSGDRSTRDERETKSTFGPARHERSGGGGGNQMYQAQDNGWKTRTSRVHPYSSPQPRTHPKSDNGYRSGTGSYDYSLSAVEPIPSYQTIPSFASSSTTAYIPEAPAQAMAAGLIPASFDANHIPRQTPVFPTSRAHEQGPVSTASAPDAVLDAWGPSTGPEQVQDAAIGNSVWG